MFFIIFLFSKVSSSKGCGQNRQWSSLEKAWLDFLGILTRISWDWNQSSDRKLSYWPWAPLDKTIPAKIWTSQVSTSYSYCLVRLQPSTILGGVLLGSGRDKLHRLGANHSQVSHDESFGSYRSISFQTKQEVYRDLRNLALLGLHVYSPLPTSHHSQWHDLCRGKFLAVKIPSTHIFIETAEITAKGTLISVLCCDEVCISLIAKVRRARDVRAELSRSQVVCWSTLLYNIFLLSGWWNIDAVDDYGSPEARWCVWAHCCTIFFCYLAGEI